jgi:soluble lytic murein transglycosylase-like protein
MAIPFLACMALVASLDRLPPRVLPSIAAVEGGQLGTISRDPDGSEDLGIMQINSSWLPVIARVTHADPTTVRERLLHEACFNISAGGAILRTYLDAEHGDLMQAIGDYHSHTPPLNHTYQLQVVAAAAKLFGPTIAPHPRRGAPPHSQPASYD